MNKEQQIMYNLLKEQKEKKRGHINSNEERLNIIIDVMKKEINK